jgi:hypothetical protein
VQKEKEFKRLFYNILACELSKKNLVKNLNSLLKINSIQDYLATILE